MVEQQQQRSDRLATVAKNSKLPMYNTLKCLSIAVSELGMTFANFQLNMGITVSHSKDFSAIIYAYNFR